MNSTDARCVLVADGHAVLVNGLRGFLKTIFGAVVLRSKIATEPLSSLEQTLGEARRPS